MAFKTLLSDSKSISYCSLINCISTIFKCYRAQLAFPNPCASCLYLLPSTNHSFIPSGPCSQKDFLHDISLHPPCQFRTNHFSAIQPHIICIYQNNSNFNLNCSKCIQELLYLHNRCIIYSQAYMLFKFCSSSWETISSRQGMVKIDRKEVV